MQVIVRDECGKVITGAKSGATITEGFIPTSIRNKNPVRYSDNDEEDNRIVAVMQRTLARHKKYKIEQDNDIKEVSMLETDITKERLSSFFFSTVFKYANVINVIEKKQSY